MSSDEEKKKPPEKKPTHFVGDIAKKNYFPRPGYVPPRLDSSVAASGTASASASSSRRGSLLKAAALSSQTPDISEEGEPKTNVSVNTGSHLDSAGPATYESFGGGAGSPSELSGRAGGRAKGENPSFNVPVDDPSLAQKLLAETRDARNKRGGSPDDGRKFKQPQAEPIDRSHLDRNVSDSYRVQPLTAKAVASSSDKVPLNLRHAIGKHPFMKTAGGPMVSKNISTGSIQNLDKNVTGRFAYPGAAGVEPKLIGSTTNTPRIGASPLAKGITPSSSRIISRQPSDRTRPGMTSAPSSAANLFSLLPGMPSAPPRPVQQHATPDRTPLSSALQTPANAGMRMSGTTIPSYISGMSPHPQPSPKGFTRQHPDAPQAAAARPRDERGSVSSLREYHAMSFMDDPNSPLTTPESKGSKKIKFIDSI